MSTHDPKNQTPDEAPETDAPAELSDDQLEDVAGGQSGDWWADDDNTGIWNG